MLFRSHRVHKEIAHQVGVAETIEETVGSDNDKSGSKPVKAIFFEGARTNNHGIIPPTEEFLTDLMIAYMRHKMPIYAVKISYSKSVYYHASSSSASGVIHILRSMMNLSNSAHVKAVILPETATTLRSSLLPAIEQAYTSDGLSYVAKKLSSKDYAAFLDYLTLTKKGDYAKDK